MRIAVLQPGHLPWLGAFDQIARVDLFVYYDDVQYDKHGWRNRNRIKTDRGWQWLTIPVRSTGRFGARIDEVEILPGSPWARKHLQALRQWYGAAPFFDRYVPILEDLYASDWTLLADLTIAETTALARSLGLETRFERASTLGIEGSRCERLVALCERFGADEYLTGEAAEDYLEEAAFADRGIRVVYQRYRHPVYPQLHGEFVSHLSIVDLLFNCGPASLDVLRTAEPPPMDRA